MLTKNHVLFPSSIAIAIAVYDIAVTNIAIVVDIVADITITGIVIAIAILHSIVIVAITIAIVDSVIVMQSL